MRPATCNLQSNGNVRPRGALTGVKVKDRRRADVPGFRAGVVPLWGTGSAADVRAGYDAFRPSV
ncbi:hypothetical protein GCM10010393_51870 [Streptomyces gobitricini]|uniref:Uncharacterized protein n=1 Tax=Streptomyces gobitricini TaxID=68211 RepID=A0ABN3N1R3_9ACTN